MDIPKEFIGRFETEEELVRRPSSIIYKARDRSLGNRLVALKVFLSRPSRPGKWAKEFEHHIASFRSASHPVLVPIIAAGVEKGWFFLSMEYVEGITLREHMKSLAGPLPLADALLIGRTIAEAVRELHRHGIPHGNISSRAIFLAGERVRLGGYVPPAISALQRELSMEGRLIVEPAYIAPEQIKGGTENAATDIYALSVLLFEMLTGRRPFMGSTPLETAMLRLMKAAPSPGRLNRLLPPLVDAIILKGLAGVPEERFQSVDEMLAAMNAWQAPAKNPLAQMAAKIKDKYDSEDARTMAFSLDELKAMLLVGAPSQRDTEPDTEPDIGPEASAESEDEPEDRTASAKAAMSTNSAPLFWLVGERGRLKGERYVLREGECLLGGGEEADIQISSGGLPPAFAKLISKPGACMLKLSGSAGILINEKLHTGSDEVPLRPGDIVTVGEETFRLVLAASEAGASVESAFAANEGGQKPA